MQIRKSNGKILNMKKVNLIISMLMIISLTNCSLISNKEKKSTSDNDSASFYSELAVTYYKSGDIKKSKEAFQKLLEIEEPKKLTDVILRKRLFFVPDTFIVPQSLVHDKFILKPLQAIHAELDYKALMSSEEHLTGVFAGKSWPGNVTLEVNRNSLEGHELEFTNRTSFTYTVMNPAETEVIGCVYFYPSRLDDYDVEVISWVTKKEFDEGTDQILLDAINNWLISEWPFEKVIYPGREINWGEFFDKLDKQDVKYEN